MSRLTVVIVNDFSFVNGGASQVALASAVALAERGHDVRLLSAVGPVSPEIQGSDVKVTLLNQQEIARDSNRIRAAIQGVWNRQAYRAMRLLLTDCDKATTVVHLHVWVKSLSASVHRAVFDAGFRTVVTMHDFFMACPNGGFFDYRQNRICQLRPLSAGCLFTNCDKRSYSQKVWRCIRQAMQQSTGRIPGGMRHFISISDLSREIMVPFLSRDARMHRVANPISVKKREAVSPADNSAFLFVGRLDPEKGPLLFAEAAARTEVDAVFVGEGVCRGQVQQLLPDAKITGWVKQEEVRKQMMTARVLVFPSLWYETQGLTVLEAAAVGIPAIVPDSSAAREMVEHNVTGMVFRGGDVTDLCDKIEAMKDAAIVARCGQVAYEQYWESPATVDRHVDELERVYQTIISNGGSK